MVSFDVSTPAYPNLTALIDDVDVPLVFDGGPRWVAKKSRKTFYVVRIVGGRNGLFELLHRNLLGLTDPKIHGDHRNGNGLDNRRENLRPATLHENARNRRRRTGGTSSFKGVSWDAARCKWTVSIHRQDRRGRQCLGRFANEIVAALVYDAEAKARYGEFAKLNFGVSK